MQDPPELINVQTVGTVGSGIAFEEDSPGIFKGLVPGRTPSRADLLMMAWMFPGGDLGYSSCMQ